MMELAMNTPPSKSLAWYCVRTQPRREQLASNTLVQRYGIEVCAPTLRYPSHLKPRGRHTEPLFPGYFFARFNAAEYMRKVNYAQGVNTLVTRGHQLVEVHPTIIQDIQSITHNDTLDLEAQLPSIGDPVNIMHGIFSGEQGTITKVMPAKERVKVLLTLLGQASPTEIPLHHIQLGFRHPLSSASVASSQ